MLKSSLHNKYHYPHKDTNIIHHIQNLITKKVTSIEGQDKWVYDLVLCSSVVL